jgi:hypothetical protein
MEKRRAFLRPQGIHYVVLIYSCSEFRNNALILPGARFREATHEPLQGRKIMDKIYKYLFCAKDVQK